MRKFGLIGAVIVVALVGLAASVRLVAPRPPELRMAGDNRVAFATGNAAYDAPHSIGAGLLCVAGSGMATITRVALHEPIGDIRVTAFAVRPNPYTRGQQGLGDERKLLSEIGGGFDPDAAQQVSGVCPSEAQLNDTGVVSKLSELGVQVAWSSGDLAGGAGLDVTYEIGGTERSTFMPFGIWLCAASCPDHPGA